MLTLGAIALTLLTMGFCLGYAVERISHDSGMKWPVVAAQID